MNDLIRYLAARDGYSSEVVQLNTEPPDTPVPRPPDPTPVDDDREDDDFWDGDDE